MVEKVDVKVTGGFLTVEAKLTIRSLPVKWVKAKVRKRLRSQMSDDTVNTTTIIIVVVIIIMSIFIIIIIIIV